MADHRFSDPEIAAVYRAIAERRDMRHFRPDPVDPALLQRLLWAAHHAPSVGFMQPWRFIRVTSRALREQMHALVETERLATARALLAQSGAERTLVLADVFGATPSNVAHRLVEGTAARLLVGVNLPMLLRALCYRHEPLEQQAARALAGGQQGMLQVGGGSAPQNQNSRKEHGQDRDHHQQ